MTDEEFLAALEHGVPAPLDVYRRAYTAAGVPWPGDDEVRRRHQVTGPDTGADVGPAEPERLVWREPSTPREQWLADAMGWPGVPQVTADEKQVADRELSAAQAEADAAYGLAVEALSGNRTTKPGTSSPRSWPVSGTTWLRLPPGEWWDAAGRHQDKDLVLKQVGPRLDAADPGRQVVTGWRHRPETVLPAWVTVQVRHEDRW